MSQTKTFLRSKVLWTICGLNKMPYFGSKKKDMPKESHKENKTTFHYIGVLGTRRCDTLVH